jgi:hypothetical protein
VKAADANTTTRMVTLVAMVTVRDVFLGAGVAEDGGFGTEVGGEDGECGVDAGEAGGFGMQREFEMET